MCVFVFVLIFIAAPSAYGNSQARDWIQATAAVHAAAMATHWILNPLAWTGVGTCATAATQATAVGFLTHLTTAGTLKKMFICVTELLIYKNEDKVRGWTRKIGHPGCAAWVGDEVLGRITGTPMWLSPSMTILLPSSVQGLVNPQLKASIYGSHTSHGPSPPLHTHHFPIPLSTPLSPPPNLPTA